MQPMNYCAHAVDALMHSYYKEYQEIAGEIKNSIKFYLPDNGNLIEAQGSLYEFANKYICEFKLPYPSIVLEFSAPPTNLKNHDGLKTADALVMLCWQTCDESIQITYVSREKSTKEWISDNIKIEVQRPRNADDLNIFITTIHDDDDDIKNISHGNLFTLAIERIAALFKFLAALSCSNTIAADVPAPAALNRKRQAKGKTPFFSYKVLQIAAGQSRSSQHTSAGGTHASPRAHLRRGHIRRLPTGQTTWVNACMVGQMARGMVAKDYRITA